MKTLLMFIWLTLCITSLVPFSALANEDDIIWRKAEHNEAVDYIAFSPDGSIIASSCGGERRIILWNADNGIILRELENPSNTRFSQVKFSPDGIYIAATAADSTIKMWLASTGKLEREFDGLWGSARAFAFSPDGTKIAIESSRIGLGQLLLFDAASGEVVREFGAGENRESGTGALVFSLDGNTLYQGSSSVLIWDVASGERVEQSLWAGDANVHYIAISKDGQVLSAASRARKEIYLYYNTEGSWNFDSSFGADEGSINGIMMSPLGGFVVAASVHGRIWDIDSGDNIYTYSIDEPFFVFNAVAVAPDSSKIAFAVASPAGDEVIVMHPRWNGVSGISSNNPGEPDFTVGSLYPHPTSALEKATLPLNVVTPGNFTIRLYTLTGEFAATLFKDALENGDHDIPIDFRPHQLAAGSYYLRVIKDGQFREFSVIVA